MKEVKVKFDLASSYITPFSADTIFGHICWAMKYIKGDEYLESFLSEYNNNPPLLISDAMPCHNDIFYVPMPVFPVAVNVRDKIRDQNSNMTDIEFASKYKRALKAKYIDSEAVKEIVSFDFICDIINKDAALPMQILDISTHNAVNRYNLSSEDVFIVDAITYDQDISMYFYLRYDSNIVSEHMLKLAMEYIENTGFGKDANIGKGRINNIEFLPSESKTSGSDNYILNLSSAYVPKVGELTERSYYNFHVKNGRLGDEYSINYSPFKKPVMMICSGALIESCPNNILGQMVKNIHWQLPNVVQYGYAYNFGVKYEIK